MVEYALLFFAVLITAALAIKLLGPKVKTTAVIAESRLGGGP